MFGSGRLHANNCVELFARILSAGRDRSTFRFFFFFFFTLEIFHTFEYFFIDTSLEKVNPFKRIVFE